MSNGWIVLVVLAVGIYALKSAGPLLLGNRDLPQWFLRLITPMPAALLAALVVTATFAKKGDLVLDARVIGVVVAMIALWRRGGFITAVLLAAIATALARQAGMA